MFTKTKISDQFQTEDIYLSATLMYYGYQVDSIGRDNPDKVRFSFLKDEQLEKLCKKYWEKKLLVDPTAFANNLKHLKNRIRSSF